MASATDTKLTGAYVQPATIIDFINDTEAPILAGALLTFKNISGVAVCDIPVGATGSVAISGTFDFPKKESAEIALGEWVCLKDGEIDKHSTGCHPVGAAVAPAKAEDATVRVALNV